jgi:hypothetical protein
MAIRGLQVQRRRDDNNTDAGMRDVAFPIAENEPSLGSFGEPGRAHRIAAGERDLLAAGIKAKCGKTNWPQLQPTIPIRITNASMIAAQ